MEVRPLPLPGLLELVPRKFEDERGYFFESYNQTLFEQLGISDRFVQDNQSFSLCGVVRGLHFQKPPFAQAKLVRVVTGKALDVVVDIRKNSPTYGQVASVELTEDQNNMLYVPAGFAHGFAALTDCVFQYKCSNVYHKESEDGIRFDDPTFRIDWMVNQPNVSAKDLQLGFFNAHIPVF